MSRKRNQKLSWSEKFNLPHHLTQGLGAIFLLTLGVLSLLSFFSLAGIAGSYIDWFLSISLGQVRYVFPILLFIISILIIQNLKYQYRSTHLIGSILFLFGFNGLVHLSDASYERALNGLGGGLVGFALANPLHQYIGYWGALTILLAILLAALILIFNTSLAHIISLHKKLFLGLGWVGRKIIAFFALFKKKPTDSLGPIITPAEFDSPEEQNEEPAEEPEEQIEEPEPENLNDVDIEEEEANFPETSESDEIQISKPKRNYQLPPVSLLFTSKSKPSSGDIKSNGMIIEETFKNFGIDVEMGEVRVGPTVTQFSFKPAKGVKLTRITTLSNDLALALAAHPIRIEAPIPGQSLVGIEVPNQRVAMVTLRELLESKEFAERTHNMLATLGKDVAGKVWLADLTKMPHLLIAGSTGSGKTVGINTIILSLLYQNTPDTLRFIMVDPKRVELTLYNGIPHLLTPVITDAPKTVNALKWTIGEMERRFDVLSRSGKRDIASYNKSSSEPLPYIVFVIDELADLMATASQDVESGIIRIAQMARAVGIHLIVATQRPSVQVITGLMKANIPARMAFSVASLIDSRTILDCPGAEKLLGRGDMLFLTAELSKPKRIQGAFVSEEEMKRVVDNLKGDEPPEYDESIVSKGGGSAGFGNGFGGGSFDQDDLFEEAKQIVVESQKASASLLQRRLKVGYARAARLLDELEEAGIVGPGSGAKPREVFTEHLDNNVRELSPSEQTMNSGGTVLNPPLPEKKSSDEDDSFFAI